MKVILLQDVAKIGRRSQIVEVPDGYARNQLIPKRMAEPASVANTKRVEKKQADIAAAGEATMEKFHNSAKSLKEAKIVIAMDVNEKGHTFKSVSVTDVVAGAKVLGVDLDEKMVSIPVSIKEAGDHKIHLICGGEKAEITIEVVKK